MKSLLSTIKENISRNSLIVIQCGHNMSCVEETGRIPLSYVVHYVSEQLEDRTANYHGRKIIVK